jgi:hypothetical protein
LYIQTWALVFFPFLNYFKGGAERLIVDAATGLSKKGNQVTIFTSHHDPNHAFHETLNGNIVLLMKRLFFSSCCWRFFA